MSPKRLTSPRTTRACPSIGAGAIGRLSVRAGVPFGSDGLDSASAPAGASLDGALGADSVVGTAASESLSTGASCPATASSGERVRAGSSVGVAGSSDPTVGGADTAGITTSSTVGAATSAATAAGAFRGARFGAGRFGAGRFAAGRFGAVLRISSATSPGVAAAVAGVVLFAVVFVVLLRGGRTAVGAAALTAATLAAASFALAAAASAFAVAAFSFAAFAAAARAAVVRAAVRLAAAETAAAACASAFTRAVCAAVLRGLPDAGRRGFEGGEESLGARGSGDAPVMPFTVATDADEEVIDDPNRRDPQRGMSPEMNLGMHRALGNGMASRPPSACCAQGGSLAWHLARGSVPSVT